MGYACPVCETPQRDAEHLANHLAFAAMLHGDDHRAWLDDEVPGWAEESPGTLGDRVAPLAPEATYEEVFDESVPEDGGDRPFADRTGVPSGAGRPDGNAMDETTRAVLAEARELTRRMRTGGAEDGTDGGGADAGDPPTEGDATGADGDDEKA